VARETDELVVLALGKLAPEFFRVLVTSAQLADFGVVDGVASEGWLLRRIGA
jgi:hypothetical protein